MQEVSQAVGVRVWFQGKVLKTFPDSVEVTFHCVGTETPHVGNIVLRPWEAEEEGQPHCYFRDANPWPDVAAMRIALAMNEKFWQGLGITEKDKLTELKHSGPFLLREEGDRWDKWATRLGNAVVIDGAVNLHIEAKPSVEIREYRLRVTEAEGKFFAEVTSPEGETQKIVIEIP